MCPRAEAEREFEAIEAAGAHYLAISEPGYPIPLAAIADAPPLIAVQSFAHLLDKPTLAIVGARNASANGMRLARKLATDLGAHGWTVASGMARSIDVIYPKENERLYHAPRPVR